MNQAVYLGDHRALARTVFNHKIYVDTRDVSIAPHLLLDGKWEMWITEAMKPFLRGAEFIDVGANFGWYSLLAEHAGARVITAYEVNPEVFRLLSDTMRVNGVQCSLVQCAVTDGLNPFEKLRFNEDDLGGGTCFGDPDEGAEGYQVWKTAPTRTLDKHSVLESDVPLVLKVDVEGFEPRVVKGAQELLTSRRATAFVEYHSHPVEEVLEMLDFFDARGYRMGHVQTDHRIHPVSREDLAGLADAEMLCFQRFES